MKLLQCSSLEETTELQAPYITSLICRSDSPIKGELGRICLTWTRDLSYPLTAMATRHGSLLMRTPPPPSVPTSTPPHHYCHCSHFSSLLYVEIREIPGFHIFLSFVYNGNTMKIGNTNISCCERQEKRAASANSKAWGKVSDRTELKSPQGNLEIYIQSHSLWKSKLKWHSIFLADTACKIDQYKLVISSWQRGQMEWQMTPCIIIWLYRDLLFTSYILKL